MLKDEDIKYYPKHVTAKGKQYFYYTAKVKIGFEPCTGKEKYYVYTGKTREEIINKVNRDKSLKIYKRSVNMNIYEYSLRWLELTKNQRKVSTARSYRYVINSRIKEFFKDKRIDDYSIDMISKYFDNLLIRGKNPNSLKSDLYILTGVGALAVAEMIINLNPARYYRLRKGPHKEREILELNEFPLFFKACETSKYKNVLSLILSCGLRVSEALGLTWDCINLETKEIIIKQQLRCIDGEAYIDHETKTGRVRRFPLSDIAYGFIMDELNIQKRRKEYLRNYHNNLNLVFTDKDGMPIKYGSLKKEFNAIKSSIGKEDIVIHSLRHSLATALINAEDVSLRQVQSILGHISPDSTNNYIHASNNEMRKAVNNINRLLNSYNI